ncbi:MAG TPA: hypothetical protein VFY23_12410 [Candidatus Limnocylindrales bacterium]|nr:hypothetical protein [Candidatus Limnocylindrales bacterium]
MRRAAMAMLLAVAACGGPAPTADAPTVPGVEARLLRYTCGGPFDFDAGIVGRPAADERVDDPLAMALRGHLSKADMDIDWLPDAGWTLVGSDALQAEFVAAGDGTDMYSVQLVREGGAWKVSGWGGCRPVRVLPDGLAEATWVLAPDQGVGPATTTFVALVTERECASGRSSEGRVVGPDVLRTGDAMLVTFAVRPLPGGQDCQGNPATRVTVILPEPLGDRRLLDGSTLPPREPVAEP